MKTKFGVLFLLLMSFGALAGCQLQALAGSGSNSDVQPFSKSALYSKGDFVVDQGKVYMAVTRVKDVDPAERVASEKAPMYPWKVSSFDEANESIAAFSLARSASSPVPTWSSSLIYFADDVVQKDGQFFKSFWWNTSNNPVDVKNQNNVLSEGVTHWGPWLPITQKQAEAIYSSNSKPSEPEIPSTPDPGTNATNTTPPDSGSVGTNTPPADVSPDIAQKYAWSSEAVYLENNVAIYNSNYFRAKWWTQGNQPNASPVNPWDTPWEVISEARFLALLAGTPPPVIQPPVQTNTNTTPPSGGGTVTPPSSSYEFLYANGYIQEWDIVSDAATLPENLKAEIAKVNRSATSGAKNFFASKLNAAQWNQLFPRRRGTPAWTAESGKTVEDYYSYANFEKALEILGNYVYFIEVALDPSTKAETFFQRNYVLNKATGKLRLINQNDDYFAADASWLLNRPYKVKVVDYNNFGTEGSDNDKIRVIAGFLAHASHETSGSWATAPGFAFDKSKFPSAVLPSYITTTLPGELAWSLYFNEEVAFSGATSSHYQDDYNKVFPPTPGQSYHGRGAFQLSWNYNYGLASAIFFGTSKVLLDNPNMIMNGGSASGSWISSRIEGGTLALLTSLMFWLTPQGSKPSQQDTMILNRNDGRYVAGQSKLAPAPSLGTPGYGWTINIMNGGYEANKSWEEGKPNYDAKVARRVKHYKFFTQALGGNNDGEVLDTYGNHSY